MLLHKQFAPSLFLLVFHSHTSLCFSIVWYSFCERSSPPISRLPFLLDLLRVPPAFLLPFLFELRLPAFLGPRPCENEGGKREWFTTQTALLAVLSYFPPSPTHTPPPPTHSSTPTHTPPPPHTLLHPPPQRPFLMPPSPWPPGQAP